MRLHRYLASSGFALVVLVFSVCIGTSPVLAATSPGMLPQVRSGGEGTKITLNEESIDGPGLWSIATNKPSNEQSTTAIMAWAGIDQFHSLNVMTSLDGFHYTNKMTLGEYSNHHPAVVQVTTSIGPVVGLAWTGIDTAHSLNILWNVYGQQPQKITLADNSAAPPALAYFDNKLWLAWTGTDPQHLLNVRAFVIASQSLTVGAAVTLLQYDSQGAPGLGVDATHNQLLLTWTDTGQSHYLPNALPYINFLTSADGRNWHTVLVAPPPQTSNAGPGILQNAPQGSYYWTWTGTDPQHSLNVTKTATINNWPAPITPFAEECIGGPAPGIVGAPEHFIIAWTGVDTLHHINLAEFAP